MRITKRIEEYIRKHVRDKAEASPELQKLKAAADLERKNFETAYQTLAQHTKAAYAKLLHEMNVAKAETFSLTLSGYWNVSDNLPAVIAYHEAYRKTDQQVRAIIEEILITMEMGGDKNTLNELLEAVHFE